MVYWATYCEVRLQTEGLGAANYLSEIHSCVHLRVSCSPTYSMSQCRPPPATCFLYSFSMWTVMIGFSLLLPLTYLENTDSIMWPDTNPNSLKMHCRFSRLLSRWSSCRMRDICVRQVHCRVLHHAFNWILWNKSKISEVKSGTNIKPAYNWKPVMLRHVH